MTRSDGRAGAMGAASSSLINAKMLEIPAGVQLQGLRVRVMLRGVLWIDQLKHLGKLEQDKAFNRCKLHSCFPRCESLEEVQ